MVELIVSARDGFFTAEDPLRALFSHFHGVEWHLTLCSNKFLRINISDLLAHWDSTPPGPHPHPITDVVEFLNRATASRVQASEAGDSLSEVSTSDRNRIEQEEMCSILYFLPACN